MHKNIPTNIDRYNYQIIILKHYFLIQLINDGLIEPLAKFGGYNCMSK